jgi:glycosyltransferase involved in cell wall biosynthesis
MLQAATDVAGRERIDAIWSTFTPGLDHTIACRIARQHGLPWVADFRDLPDQTYDTPRSRWCVRSEMRVCRHASALTTVSPDLKARLEARYRQPVLVITNGYDAEDYPPPPAGPTARFTLRYFGRLYAYRDPGPLFSALDELLRRDAVENRDEFRVQFFGTNAEDLAHRLQGHRCQGIVECCARLGRREMVRMQQEASVLLLLKSERAGSTPAKIFEYLGAQRPILNVPGDEGPVDHILRETKAGQSVREAKDIAEAILGHYRTWKACGRTEYEGTAEKLQPYQRAYQAGQLAELLDSLCQP